LERGFIGAFSTSRTLNLGIDTRCTLLFHTWDLQLTCPSPLLCSYAANKVGLQRVTINSATDLTLSQFFKFITQLTLATVSCVFVFDGKGRPKKKRGRNVIVQHAPASHTDARSFINAAGFHSHTVSCNIVFYSYLIIKYRLPERLMLNWLR
jgi:hypothetical protein